MTFQVTSVTQTGQLTAVINLPAGSHLLNGGHSHDGWTCQASPSGATCQHDPIPAGSQASGSFYIQADNKACDQVLTLTVSSGPPGPGALHRRPRRAGR